MESKEIVSMVAQILGLFFIFIMGVVWLIGAKKDGKLTKDEIAPISIIGVFIFMMIINGMRSPETLPVFDANVVTVVLLSVLLLAGIDIAKIQNVLNGNRRENNSDSDKPDRSDGSKG